MTAENLYLSTEQYLSALNQLRAIALSALQDKAVVLAQRVLTCDSLSVYPVGYELICELLELCEVQTKKRRAS